MKMMGERGCLTERKRESHKNGEKVNAVVVVRYSVMFEVLIWSFNLPPYLFLNHIAVVKTDLEIGITFSLECLVNKLAQINVLFVFYANRIIQCQHLS